MSEIFTISPFDFRFSSSLAALILTMSPQVGAAPFAVQSSSQLRTDFSVSWASFSPENNAPVPDGAAFPASDGEAGLHVSSPSEATLTLSNQSGTVMLASPGPEGIVLTLGRSVQGVGLTAQHRDSKSSARYQVEFQDNAGKQLFTVDGESSPGKPAYLGGVDPDGRIRRVVINSAPGNFFHLSPPSFQLRRAPVTDFTTLPVASQKTLEITPTDTYLHQGLGVGNTDVFSDDAPVTNKNAFLLSKLFPTLRGGDMIRAQRVGFSLNQSGLMNQLLAVFSRTLELKDGASLNRVTGAIPAGIDFYTPKVFGRTFSTPTNIPEDFTIGDSTFIKVPPGASCILFSLASPGAGSAPATVRLSHVPRSQFAEWVASFGLHGNLADPHSDFDGDGLTLLEEFAFMKDPTEPDGSIPSDFSFKPNAFVESGNPNRLTLLFGARLDAPLQYRAEFSSDLRTWKDSVDSSGVVPFYPDESDSSRSIFSVTDPNPGARRFGRIRVEQIPPAAR